MERYSEQPNSLSPSNLPCFYPFESCFTNQYNPEEYVRLLQSKIESRFSNSVFIEDLVQEMVNELSDATTQIDRLNRSVCEDLTKMGLISYKNWLEQVRKTQAWFVEFTSEKLNYITRKYLNIKGKEMAKPQQKTYCSICNKQLREAKIIQISNSLNTTCHLAEYKGIREDQEVEPHYNELDIIMNQIQKSKKQLLTLNNEKTIYSLQQFLHQTNHTIQVFYQDRTNFQRMQDNRDVIAVLFKEFITKFMEVSHNDIKPTVIKCAADLADFLFKRRRDGMEFTEKQVQTTAPYPAAKTSRNTEATKSRSTTKDAKESLKKNQELLVEHKMKIEMLSKQNSNLERQIKHLHTQKILSSVKMIEEDNVLEGGQDEIEETKQEKEGRHQKTERHSGQQKRVDFDEGKSDIDSLRIEAAGAKRVTILRTSVKHSYKPLETQFSRQSNVSGGKFSHTSHKSNPSYISHSNNSNNAFKQLVQYQYQESQHGEKSEVSKSFFKSKTEIHVSTSQFELQVQPETQEQEIQTQEVENPAPVQFYLQNIDQKRKLLLQQPENPPVHKRQSVISEIIPNISTSSYAPSIPLKREVEMSSTAGDWGISHINSLNRKQIIESKQRSSSSQSSDALSPQDLKSQEIKNELITMVAKMNFNNMREVSNSRSKHQDSRKSRASVLNRSSLEENKNFLIGRGIKPLTGISARTQFMTKDIFRESTIERKQEEEESGDEGFSKMKTKSTPRGFEVLSQTQNRFGKKERSSQKVSTFVYERKSNELSASNNIASRAKRQTQIVERMKTQVVNQYIEQSFNEGARTHTQCDKQNKENSFSKTQLIQLFGSLQMAYQYESSPNSKHKLSTKQKKRHQILISSISAHLDELKTKDNSLYHRIKGFIKFPYQSVVNQFQGPLIQSSFSLGTFINLINFLLNRHDNCERVDKKAYCQHIENLLLKFRFIEDKEKNCQKVSLPKLQEPTL